MARKSKGRRPQKQQRKLELTTAEYIFPREKSSYWTGVIAVLVIFVWLAGMAFFIIKNPAGQRLWYIPLEILAWPVLTVIVCNLLAARPRLQQIKGAGRQSKVMSNNYPELHRVLVRQAELLGFAKPPDMYIVSDSQPVIYSIPHGPGAIICSTGLREALAEAEVETLIAHELTHIRGKHVRLELAMVFIRSANPIVKVLFFPVLLMVLFARAWLDLIDFTADRGAFLVTLKPAVMNSAIVKLAVVSDPNAGITKEELQEFLSSTGDIQTDSQQLERHFKVGQFMDTQPNLKERIEQLREFPRTEQGRQALAKMAEIQGVPLSSLMAAKTTRAEVVEQVEDDEFVDSSPEL